MSSINRPVLQKDAYGNVTQQSYDDVAFRGEYAANNLMYKGIARVGTLDSSASWQLAKLNYDGSNNLLSVLWPVDDNGVPSSDFIFVWDDRASYTYI